MKSKKKVIGWDAVRQVSDRLAEIERRLIEVETSPVLSLSETHLKEVQWLKSERAILRVAQGSLLVLLE